MNAKRVFARLEPSASHCCGPIHPSRAAKRPFLRMRTEPTNDPTIIPGGGMVRRFSHDNHASAAALGDCLGPCRPVVWVPGLSIPKNKNFGENTHGAPQVRCLPRPASPDR